MAEIFANIIPKHLTIMTSTVISFLILSTMGVCLPPKPYDIADRFRNDNETIKLASTDYGHIVHEIPASVFHPTSVNDTAILIKFAYNNNTTVPITIAARGRGHSVRGQAMARGGVVVNMTSLENRINGSGISVSRSPFLGFFADVGGEQLWIDVLHATLEHGLSPVSWTDYLYLTVGGTLSNAGISGQTFRFGPQISNVYELDVITGKGDIVTCSTKENSELYYAVLGGLGQFGIITRARIALKPAPTRVKWLRMLYNDFSAFSRDQEHLISINGRKQAFDYLEGMLLLNQAPPPDVSFFPEPDQPRIISLVTQHGIIYCIEAAIYYDDRTVNTVDKELQVLVKGLSFLPGFIFEKNVSYVDFVNRVRSEEQILRSKGLWDIPHPWLNLFVPRSRVSDFDSGVFKNIILKHNISAGLVLLYPMNRNKWDDNMSAVIPEEDVFYVVSLLRSSGFNMWEAFDRQNEEILQFCENVGIKVKTYLSHYETQESWIKHFGSKWGSFQERKAQFDPKMILAPGQRIFNK